MTIGRPASEGWAECCRSTGSTLGAGWGAREVVGLADGLGLFPLPPGWIRAFEIDKTVPFGSIAIFATVGTKSLRIKSNCVIGACRPPNSRARAKGIELPRRQAAQNNKSRVREIGLERVKGIEPSS
ncbi:MAG: hypothetical protein KF769_02815 [Parvibaculum sp.]|nr:hypothetical protein [Parvibaculum sp.]